VDRFADVVVIHADEPSILSDALPSLRESLPESTSAYAKVHPRAASRLTPAALREFAPSEPLWGRPADEVTVTEMGVRYVVRPPAGLSVGLFLDMREVRRWLRGVVRGRSILNLFAYTCSLGVCATLGGAMRVLNLDVSRPYLEWGKANYRLNGLQPDDRDFIYGDAFDWLHRFARREQRFDMVIVDPPSFSSTPFSVTRDYPRLVTAAASVVSEGGAILAATNHAATSEAHFNAWLREGIEAAHRQGRIIERWHEPLPDFPVAEHKPPYLKVRALALDQG
jgi:23S rRNA (cytosine1962-C5)-methyltransferase